MITSIEMNNVGAISDEAKISVDAVSASSYTVTAGKKGVSLQNVGGKVAWFGGSTVDPANSRGNKLFPNQMIIYHNVKRTFKIYFLCGAGDTSEIGVTTND